MGCPGCLVGDDGIYDRSLSADGRRFEVGNRNGGRTARPHPQ